MSNIDMRPLQRPEAPDFQQFLKVIRRQGDASYVPFLEMVFEPSYLEPITGLTPPCELQFAPTAPNCEASFGYYLQACAAAGFDHGTINLNGFAGFPRKHGAVSDSGRGFVQAADCAIRSMEDFEAYPWPAANQIDVDAMARTAALAPAGMGVLTGSNAPFELLMELLGFENLAIMLYEQPELVQVTADRIGSIMVDVADLVCSLPFIDGYLHAGDMGHKSGTMISPDDLRKYTLPWDKKVAAAAHKHDKICLLHSCGNLYKIMPDIIDCGFDGKHSFEDAITPGLLELHAEFGDQICLIGGIDVDFLCRSDEAAIRARVREYIDKMGPNGGYILGSGNSIPDYCPMEHWWVMLDEGLRYGR